MSLDENKFPTLLRKPSRKNDLSKEEKEKSLSGKASIGSQKSQRIGLENKGLKKDGVAKPTHQKFESWVGVGAPPLAPTGGRGPRRFFQKRSPSENHVNSNAVSQKLVPVLDLKNNSSKKSKAVGETQRLASQGKQKKTAIGPLPGAGAPRYKKNEVFFKPTGGRGPSVKIIRKTKRTNLNVGDLCILKISALGPNWIGIDEYSYSFPIYVPNTSLKDTVKAKIVRVNLKGNKYAIAKLLKVKEKIGNPYGAASKLTFQRLKIEPNQILTVNIKRLARTGAGLIHLKYGYKLIVPQAIVGKQIKILVTKLKSRYGFAKIIMESYTEFANNVVAKQGLDPSWGQGPLVVKPEGTKSIKNSGVGFASVKNLSPLRGITNSKKTLLKSLGLRSQEGDYSPNPALIIKRTLRHKRLGLQSQGLQSQGLQSQPLNVKFLEGSKYTLTLPKKAKKFGNYLFLKFQNAIIFLKLGLNAKPGDKIRIKITKVKNKFLIGKIIQINPLSLIKKRILVRNNIRQMIQNGMHLGEKAVKCNARMKNYVWLKQQSLSWVRGGRPPHTLAPTWGRGPHGQKFEGLLSSYDNPSLGRFKSLKERKVLEIGWGAPAPSYPPLVKKSASQPQLGSAFEKSSGEAFNPTLAPNWGKGLGGNNLPRKTAFLNLGCKANPAPGRGPSRPLIKKGNHVINLLKTRRCLNKALTKLTKYALKGRTFLFIGTKKAAAGLIARASLFSKNSFFVNTRWLGGLLTNWKTIRKSISKIRPILQEKQKIVADILEKRKRIKQRLIKKGLFIKNKTLLILKQGRSLLTKFKNPGYKAFILEKTKTLVLKQKELLENCQILVSRHKVLEIKRRKVMYQNIVLKQHIANTILARYNNLLRQLTIYTQKLRQLKYFLILSNGLKKIKNKAYEENTTVLNIGLQSQPPAPNKEAGRVRLGQGPLTIDTKKIKTLMKSTGSLATVNILPHPPKDILNFILLTVKKNSKALSAKFKETDLLFVEPKSSTNNKVLLVSDFVSSLSRFVPELQTLIQTYEENINLIKKSLTNYSNVLNKLKIALSQDIEFHQILVKELIGIKIKLISQRNIIRIVKTKLNHFARQKRILKFLPRLRHFKISVGYKSEAFKPFVSHLLRSTAPTPGRGPNLGQGSAPSTFTVERDDIVPQKNAAQANGPQIFKNKIISIVQILMRKIVDPKLKYPVDNIYDEKLSHYSKKIASARKKKWQRFEKYFGGIAKMTAMTKSQISKNVAIIIGQNEEINAIRECKKLGIKMFNIVDTNCNPTFADHIIPANDDSRNSIKYVLNKFLIRIRLAHKLRKKMQQKQNKNSAYKKLQTMANQMRKNYHLYSSPKTKPI